MTISFLNNNKVFQKTLNVRTLSDDTNNEDGKAGIIEGSGMEVGKGSYYSSRRNSYLLAIIVIIFGCMMLVNVEEASALVLGRLSNNYQANRRSITYAFGGRVGTYDLFMKNVTSNNTIANVALIKKNMAKQYRSTWCTVPYQNDTVIDYKREMCVIDTYSNKFYVMWDGYNVLQVDTSSNVEPSLKSIAAFKITIPGNLPDVFSGQLFAIVNEKFSMNCDHQNVSASLYTYLSANGQQYLIPNTTMMYYMTATEASDFILNKTNYYFRIYNHPSGSGVYVMSEVFGLCINRFDQYNHIDKLYEIGFEECDVTNENQKFFWTGTSLISASATKQAYTLRFFSMMYGNSIGLVNFNTRQASSLSLMLITDDNKIKNPFITKSDVLNSSAIVEDYYKTRSILEFDSTLQDQLAAAVIPFTYSSASNFSVSIYLFMGLLSVLVNLL